MTDYVPPHSLEAETSVLGSCLASSKAASIAADLLDPRDFYRSAHGVVFAVIQELAIAGKDVDPVTVGNVLTERKRIDEVGGSPVLFDLAAQVTSPSAIESYCDIVSAKAAKRHARQAAVEFANKVPDVEDLDAEVDALAVELSGRRRATSLQDPDVIAEEFVRRLAGETTPAWPSGWTTLDRLWQLPKGLLTVVTGLPSSGKSTWLDVLIWKVCQADDSFRVAYFSPESAPAAKHLVSLVHTSLGTDPLTASGGLGQRIEEARAWWQQRVSWINDDRDNTPSAVLAVARQKARQGLDLLVVDPYNNLSPDSRRSTGDRQDLYIQDLLRRFKRFGRETGCAVVIVAHPRQVPIVHGTEAVFQVPTAAHISGGQEWWNHADSVVCVWRNQSGESPEEFGAPEDVRIVVQKVRDTGQWGRQGSVTLRFAEDERRYKETRA